MLNPEISEWSRFTKNSHPCMKQNNLIFNCTKHGIFRMPAPGANPVTHGRVQQLGGKADLLLGNQSPRSGSKRTRPDWKTEINRLSAPAIYSAHEAQNTEARSSHRETNIHLPDLASNVQQPEGNFALTLKSIEPLPDLNVTVIRLDPIELPSSEDKIDNLRRLISRRLLPCHVNQTLWQQRASSACRLSSLSSLREQIWANC